MPFDDLYLVAAQGLLKGCRRYDPERLNPTTGEPYALSTICVPFIRGAMAQWLRDRGHSSGVRFPDRWRDKAPTVRRLAGDGSSLAVICQATGLSAQDVEAILQAQGATRCFDPEAAGFAVEDPDPFDEAEAFEELAEALAIADRAHAALGWADREMLEQAWIAPRRRTLARLQFGQFLVRVGQIRRGQAPQRSEQQGLALELPAATAEEGSISPRRRLTEPAEILQVAEQLALFKPCRDQGESGKTAAAEIGGSGAAGDQPSTGQGQPAELPSSAPRGGARRP